MSTHPTHEQIDKLLGAPMTVNPRMLTANDIPVAHTPEGGWHGEMPPPILARCTEPLRPAHRTCAGSGRPSRSRARKGRCPGILLNNHVERVEQCGNRVVVTSEGVIHDMRADGTLENGVNDVAAARLGSARFEWPPSSTRGAWNSTRSDPSPGERSVRDAGNRRTAK